MDGKGIDSYLLWRWKRENFSGDRIGSAGSGEWNEGSVYATEDSGELKILDQISRIEVIHLKKSFGFYKTLSEQGKKEMSEMYFRLWKEILVKARKEEYDVLVMDEFMAAYNYGLIPNEDAITFLKEKPERMEIVLTGRNPDERLIELADYVSVIKKRKHPFDRGIYARKGIEY